VIAPFAVPTQPAPQGDVARVLLCDDSAVIRSAMGRMLDSDPAVRVIARVANGQQAVEAVQRERFDVVVLDIEMPVMDGMTAPTSPCGRCAWGLPTTFPSLRSPPLPTTVSAASCWPR